MDYKTVVKFYGGVTHAAKALGYTRQAIYSWRDNGVPARTQELISVMTAGKLKAKGK